MKMNYLSCLENQIDDHVVLREHSVYDRMMKQPEDLRNSCIRRIAQIVFDLCFKEMFHPNSVPYAWLKEQILLVPPNLVNEVVIQTLFAIDQIAFDTYHHQEFPGQYIYIEKMLRTILHPDVTEIITHSKNYFRSGSDTSQLNYIVSFLFRFLFSLRKLKVIEFTTCTSIERPLIRDGYVPELEKFSCHSHCSNKIVESVIRSSICLKHLDVRGSKNVNDDCIDSILGLSHLQHLNISETGISSNGLKVLVCNIKLEQLKFLGISEDSLELLLENSSHMTQLCGLSLVCRNESHVQQMIKNVGKQLLYLHLSVCSSDLVNVLGEYCTSLKSLHIDEILEDNFNEVQELKYQQGFLSIKEMILVAKPNIWLGQYILNHCVNVENLKLETNCIQHRAFIREVLEKNPMLHLKRMYWKSPEECEETVADMMEHIPSLEELCWESLHM